MINFNGNILSKKELIFDSNNRAFKYGDGVFETLKLYHSKIVFLEDHYFRLMASMRMLRMEIPANFTLEFFQNEIIKSAKSLNLTTSARVRMTVYRKDGGLYSPTSNEIDYVIEVSPLVDSVKQLYKVDLYKDYYVYSGLLSTIKTTNRILNIVSSIYSKENGYDSCLLINEKKQLVEAIHGNVFLVFGTKIVTPSIEEGCIKGIVRKKIIALLKSSDKFEIEERAISPFEIQKADEMFITNSIIDIQSVTNYRKKTYETKITTEIIVLLKEEYA